MPAPKLSLKARALRYLSMREHSRMELSRKLSRYAEEADNIEALMDWLETANFLSQDRFSESLVNRRAARFGNNRILSELQSHGIEGEALKTIKADLTEGETTRAAEILVKKFGQAPENSAERAKYMRFLQQRGFSFGAIQHAIRLMEKESN
jgi:regulatory protein